jgi:hypothetical protein
MIVLHRCFAALAACALVATLALAPAPAQATEKYLPSVSPNAPPARPFAQFDRIEILPITLAPPFDRNKANHTALERTQAHFNGRVTPLATMMNARPPKSDPATTLVVEPTIVKVKFVGTGARIWAGAMAGSSQVLMKLRITDKATGAVIAEPEFYQRANAWGGAYSAGSTDNDMLGRLTDLVSAYLGANMETAVGGPTGAEGLSN